MADNENDYSAAGMMTVICAWCERIMTQGAGDLATTISHGICDECTTTLTAALNPSV